jgi:hypothetical protein
LTRPADGSVVITEMELTPDREMLFATWAIIQSSLPPAYHRTQEYEYEIDGDVPIRLEVWKKNATTRRSKSKVITLNEGVRAMMTPILERVQKLLQRDPHDIYPDAMD